MQNEWTVIYTDAKGNMHDCGCYCLKDSVLGKIAEIKPYAVSILVLRRHSTAMRFNVSGMIDKKFED